MCLSFRCVTRCGRARCQTNSSLFAQANKINTRINTEQHPYRSRRWERGNRCQSAHGECGGNGSYTGLMFYPILEIDFYRRDEIRSWGELTHINKCDSIYRLGNGRSFFFFSFLLFSNHFCELCMWPMCNYTSVIVEMRVTNDERSKNVKMFLILVLVRFVCCV